MAKGPPDLKLNPDIAVFPLVTEFIRPLIIIMMPGRRTEVPGAADGCRGGCKIKGRLE